MVIVATFPAMLKQTGFGGPASIDASSDTAARHVEG
jgi:hypothetical protein